MGGSVTTETTPETVPAHTSAPTDAPAAQSALDAATSELRADLRALASIRLFWVGLALKLVFAFSFGSHFATRWFAPFAYEFAHGHFANPWEAFIAKGEPMAFPYGPGMLLSLTPAWLPATFLSFDPSGHWGLFLLRLPVLAADLTICLLLLRWLRVHARDVVLSYWLSPIALYASYVHGQLDLIPTALLCVALYFVFARRAVTAGVVFGFALATKLHLLVAFPFAVLYLFRLRSARMEWLRFLGVAGATMSILYAPCIASPAFREMVLESAESQKIWTVAIPYGLNGLTLYIAPAAILVALLRFASYRKVNRELTLMFVGALYVAMVALVPPQPGWFIWSLPFVAYLGTRFTRIGTFILAAVGGTYLVYFFASDPTTFLEALNPTFGADFGASAAAALTHHLPALGGAHLSSIAWTGLFSATALAAVEMYRKGVRSNAVYDFREESFMIGIGGDSGAGKHTVANDVAKVIGPRLSLIYGDDDHKWERGHEMWKLYTHLDPRSNLLAVQQETLASLRRGGDIRKRHYDHDRGRFTSKLLVRSNEFVALVGLHPFYLPLQRELLHLKVFVDPDEDLRRRWKIDRDMAKRGYTRDQVLEQIEKRMEDSKKYVRPQAKHADLVLRQIDSDNARPDFVVIDILLVNELDPLTLLEVFNSIDSLKVSWTPDEDLMRDTIHVEGTITATQIDELAPQVLPNPEELVSDPAWASGGRGVMQLAILHAISARLRRPRGQARGDEVP